MEEQLVSEKTNGFSWVLKGITTLLLIAIAATLFFLVRVAFFPQKIPRSELERALFAAEAEIKANPKDAQAHAELAAAYFRLGRVDEAVKEYKKAITLKPKNPSYHFGLGFVYYKTGKLNLAIKEFKAENAIASNHEAYFYLGEIYKQRKEYDLAIEVYQKAIETGSFDADAHFGLATVYNMKGEKELAKKEYQETLRYVPDHAGALAALRRLGG